MKCHQHGITWNVFHNQHKQESVTVSADRLAWEEETTRQLAEERERHLANTKVIAITEWFN